MQTPATADQRKMLRPAKRACNEHAQTYSRKLRVGDAKLKLLQRANICNVNDNKIVTTCSNCNVMKSNGVQNYCHANDPLQIARATKPSARMAYQSKGEPETAAVMPREGGKTHTYGSTQETRT